LNEFLEGATVRTLRASTEARQPTLEELAQGIEPQAGPLVFLSLTFTPLNPPPTPTPPPVTPVIEPTAEPTAGDRSITPTPGCEGVVEWVEDWVNRLEAFAAIHGEILDADAQELGSLDPALLRRAAADLRALAIEQAGSGPPAVAVAANAALVGLFNRLADAIDRVADAVESGDQAAIDAATADLTASIDSLNEDAAAAFDALVETCPELEAIA
jgi:hypothetical protein